MKYLHLGLLTIALGVSPARADEDEVAKAMSRIAALGPGVPTEGIKRDNKGRITSCIVVGQARISTALGTAKGLEVARDKARLDARGRFVQWLQDKVSMYEKSEDETILFLEGSEENDKDALKESGKAIEKQTKKMESIAQGLVRGLQVLHVEQSGKDKTYTMVMGWDAKTARAAAGVREDNEGTPAGKKPDAPKEGDPKRPAPDKKIEDKKTTSPDAKKFIK